MKVGILGVGLLSAGLDGWMKDVQCWPAPVPTAPGRYLSPSHPCCRPTNVAAAATPCWALHVADEAVRQSGLHAQELATVFASSGGNGCLGSVVSRLNHPTGPISDALSSVGSQHAAGYWALRPAVSNPRPRCPPMTIRPPWDY